MAEYTSELRAALATISGVPLSVHMALTEEMLENLRYAGNIYAAATRDVNLRLFKCEQLIGLGQRSEALRQAMIEPDLFRQIAELDIPARAAWIEFAGRTGLPAPGALNMQAVALLNQAFSMEKSIESLLQQFRLLSLARASMPQRLNVLRLLVKAEPANTSWMDDLTRFEQVRCEEIRTLAVRVRQKKEWDLVEQLSEEVQSPLWVNRPPLDVIDAVIRARDELMRDEARRALLVLSGRLNDAIRMNDLGSAVAVKSDVLTVMNRFELKEADPLLDPFRQGFEWIVGMEKAETRMNEFRKKVRELSKAIHDHQEWWYIEQCYRQARDFQMPIPDEILAAYLAARSKRGILKQVLIFGGILLLVVVVVLLLVMK